MVIHNVWVFTKKSGTSLYHKKYGSVEVDESLFSGFLSSINTLAESEFDQKGVESLKMGDYKFIYENFCGVLFTVAVDPDDSDDEIKNMLVDARKRFFEQFSDKPWEFYLKDLAQSGKVEHFKNFQKTLDEVITEYKEIKSEEVKNKEIILDFYNTLINKFYLKVIGFSDILDEDFTTPLANIINDLIKNNPTLNKIKVSENGISFSSVDIKQIGINDFKRYLHEILEGLINGSYNLMGSKPIDKIIGQLGSNIANKLPEIQKLEICQQILQIILKPKHN